MERREEKVRGKRRKWAERGSGRREQKGRGRLGSKMED